MFNPTFIVGQWAGFFEYGPEYGEHLHGEKVEFRLYIDLFIDGQFFGHCVDIEGIGANFERAKIKGFINNHFISFTKEYPHLHEVDEQGNMTSHPNRPHLGVTYEGEYNNSYKSFSGQWEIEAEIFEIGDRTYLDIVSGKWEMRKDD